MEKNTIGKAIGKVKRSLTVRQYKGATGTQISVTIDFSNATDDEIRSWVASDRVIAGQRPWRSLSDDEVKALDGRTFQASTIGQKVKSRSDQIAELVNAGIPEQLAGFALDNPEQFAQIMANATKAASEVDTAGPDAAAKEAYSEVYQNEEELDN